MTSCDAYGFPYARIPKEVVEETNPGYYVPMVNSIGDAHLWQKDSLLVMFQVDLENLDDVENAVMSRLKQGLMDIHAWPYHIFETKAEKVIEAIKKEQDQNNKGGHDKGHSMGDPQRQASDMMRKAQANQPKMPKLPNMPKF